MRKMSLNFQEDQSDPHQHLRRKYRTLLTSNYLVDNSINFLVDDFSCEDC